MFNPKNQKRMKKILACSFIAVAMLTFTSVVSAKESPPDHYSVSCDTNHGEMYFPPMELKIERFYVTVDTVNFEESEGGLFLMGNSNVLPTCSNYNIYFTEKVTDYIAPLPEAICHEPADVGKC